MAQNVTARNHVLQQRRRSNAGVTLFLVFVLLCTAIILAIGFLSPARLAMPHEMILAFMHGGVADSREQATVECALPNESGIQQATTRFTRTIRFHDGTSLVVTFDSTPAPTALHCGG